MSAITSTPGSASAQSRSTATMVVSAQVLRPAVPAATLAAAVADAAARSALEPQGPAQVALLADGVRVTARERRAGDAARPVRVEYLAN